MPCGPSTKFDISVCTCAHASTVTCPGSCPTGKYSFDEQSNKDTQKVDTNHTSEMISVCNNNVPQNIDDLPWTNVISKFIIYSY